VGVLNFWFAMSNKSKEPARADFETSMDRLESIVEQMESGKLPLEDLIQRYEEGMKLVKICQERLANAEQKIEIIVRNSSGKPTVKDFEATATKIASESISDETKEQSDEARLF
jgi:exodeoxyribonuclease VII small subunit